MGDVSLLKMRMEGQSLLDSGEESAAKYSSRVGRARLANQNARKQARATTTLSTATVTTATTATTALAAATLAAVTLAAVTIAAANLAATTLATPPRPMPHPTSRCRHPSISSAAPLVTASVRTTLAADRHPLTYPHIHPSSHRPTLCRKWASSLSGLTTLLWSSRVKRSPLVSLHLASCACSGRPCRPWAVQRSQEEAGPLPLVLERAASKSRRFHRL